VRHNAHYIVLEILLAFPSPPTPTCLYLREMVINKAHNTMANYTQELRMRSQYTQEGRRLDVLTAVVMKSSAFWDIMPCTVSAS
jgi:hypothetical protein